MEDASKSGRRFTQHALPWVIAVGAFILYLATLNHGISLNSLPLTARVAGWDWQPMILQPVLFVLTAPMRLLPVQWVPVALNGFSALCAALVLGSLARSAALLPQDRHPDQRRLLNAPHGLLRGWNAWLPPVLACAVCGLQLSFWEHATTATAEMLDLLLFAYAIQCLLEHRLDGKSAWLDRAMLVWGLGMADTWSMVGLFPLFVGALAWIKRRQFLNRRLLRRWALFALAGLALVFVPAVVQAFSAHSPVSIWQGLIQPFVAYKDVAVLIGGKFAPYFDVLDHKLRFPVQKIGVAALLFSVSLLPVMVMSFRWPNFFGDESEASTAARNFAFLTSHACFLGLGIWLAFDPPISPGQLVPRRLALAVPCLSAFYLSALSVAYYSGYFLVLFGPRPHEVRVRNLSRFPAVRWIVPKLVPAVFLVALLGLLWKNVPAIREKNLPLLQEFGALAARCLPADKAIILGEDPARLHILRDTLARSGNRDRYLLVDLLALPNPAYRDYLERESPRDWQPVTTHMNPRPAGRAGADTKAYLSSFGVVQLLASLTWSNRLFLLHPGFGERGEMFALHPRGLVYEVTRYPPSQLDTPPPTAEEVAFNASFWSNTTAAALAPLSRLIAEGERRESGPRNGLMKLTHITRAASSQSLVVGMWYSCGLNVWGTTLQRGNHLEAAQACFERALELNPVNLAATANLQCNASLRKHARLSVDRERVEDPPFRNYQAWMQAMSQNGPFDEPNFCYGLGRVYGEQRLLRLAGQQFERVKALAPGDLASRLLLSELFMVWRMPEEVGRLLQEIRQDPNFAALRPEEVLELQLMEARTAFAQTNAPKAERILRAIELAHTNDAFALNRVLGVYLARGSLPDALRIVDQQLRIEPDNVPSLVNKGFLFIKQGAYSNAILPLTRALSLTNSQDALFNRAVAYLRAGNLEASQADYVELERAQKEHPEFRVAFGLGEIAFRRKDTNTAIRYCRQYLATAPTNSNEAKAVLERLKALQAGSP